MKKLKSILGLILICILFSCKSEIDKKRDILINSAGKEWRCEKVKGHSLEPYYSKLCIIFHKDSTYEIYRKKNDRRVNVSSDLIYEYKWFIDSVVNCICQIFMI